MRDRVQHWRRVRDLARNFPDRYKLWAKVLKNDRGKIDLIWVLYELKEWSPTYTPVDESHSLLIRQGWDEYNGMVIGIYSLGKKLFVPQSIPVEAACSLS